MAERTTKKDVTYKSSGGESLVDPVIESISEDDLSRKLRQHLGRQAYRLAELSDGSKWDILSVLNAIEDKQVDGFVITPATAEEPGTPPQSEYVAYKLFDAQLGSTIASHFLEHYRIFNPQPSSQV